jgi:hypothetical protein
MNEPIGLSRQPTSLTVAGERIISIIAEIERRGGHVAGMAQDGQRNGVWKVRIEWPPETLFSQKTTPL